MYVHEKWKVAILSIQIGHQICTLHTGTLSEWMVLNYPILERVLVVTLMVDVGLLGEFTWQPTLELDVK
jgi:hypothetical protein